MFGQIPNLTTKITSPALSPLRWLSLKLSTLGWESTELTGLVEPLSVALPIMFVALFHVHGIHHTLKHVPSQN